MSVCLSVCLFPVCLPHQTVGPVGMGPRSIKVTFLPSLSLEGVWQLDCLTPPGSGDDLIPRPWLAPTALGSGNETKTSLVLSLELGGASWANAGQAPTEDAGQKNGQPWVDSILLLPRPVNHCWREAAWLGDLGHVTALGASVFGTWKYLLRSM